MTKTIIVSDSAGESREVGLVVGSSLMDVLRDEGYEEIQAICGGCCSCATCHVHIDQSSGIELAPIEEDEELLLSLADNYQADRSRLSCQIQLSEAHAGMAVSLLEPE